MTVDDILSLYKREKNENFLLPNDQESSLFKEFAERVMKSVIARRCVEGSYEEVAIDMGNTMIMWNYIEMPAIKLGTTLIMDVEFTLHIIIRGGRGIEIPLKELTQDDPGEYYVSSVVSEFENQANEYLTKMGECLENAEKIKTRWANFKKT